jgi:glycosyltransferase involved in cell wall biosynthesis
MHPLRIAMVVPPWYEVPPQGYGGLEVIAAALVDGLVERGHQVTLFGAGTRTGTRARFVSTTPQPQYRRLNQLDAAVRHTAEVNRRLSGAAFDLVHDHTTDGPLTAAARRVPTVLTVHSTTEGEVGDYLSVLGDSVRLVAISWLQRLLRPGLNWVATVPNALSPREIPGGDRRPDGPVVWLARFCPDKGPDLAIQACRAAGLPLVLAGKATEPGEVRYLERTIRPMLGPDVELRVNADRETGQRLLAEARCLVMPIRWAEPFGMVMIEAMAHGTPVVALNRGAVPELVRNGVTGWICERPEDLPDALHLAGAIDPGDCVRHVRDNFSADLMARRYERVYREVLGERPAAVSGRSRSVRY